MISELAVDLNHNENFLAAITDAVKDVADITILMRKIFQSENNLILTIKAK